MSSTSNAQDRTNEMLALLQEQCWRWTITSDKLRQEVEISGETNEGNEFLITAPTLAEALQAIPASLPK